MTARGLVWMGVPTDALRDRLPADLRDAPSGPDFDPFTSLYLLDDEFAAEMANRTVHAVMHLGWVPDGAATGGRWRSCSSRTGCSAPPTWPRSSRSGT